MADRTFTLEIITPDRVVVSDDQVVSLTVPGVEGYLGILSGHAPIMTELTLGEITVRRADGKEIVMAESRGFMEASDNKVTILADSAEKADEIDVDRAKESIKRAEERLADAASEIDRVRAEASLKRALNRLRVAQRTM